MNSGPIFGEFGTKFFLSIFFTKIAYFNFYFRNSTKCFICSSIIVCLKTCLNGAQIGAQWAMRERERETYDSNLSKSDAYLLYVR